ncbi:TetR/AcrR family transcriptional regulator [Liquorilactobacillus oeni]|uniref:Transcriptional regulator n=1 Tax=Liquorilactobacillus oeni DSM 19972 TaxID=1423777 RepID=A0A0R1MN38_9LACO|nr:TetR/AcrR family transcriptional regulator [Liquorilactobacillus oeni]KRL05400.1 transcriptional regulator [Liquorilactobacillus oeni DSM 19972]
MGLDRRPRKTRQIIENSLVQILQQKPLTKITVAEIVKKADISRSTFYLHYNDIYDLYDKINNTFLTGLLDSFETYYPSVTESFFELAQRLIDYIEQNEKLSKIFINEKNVAVIDRLCKLLIDKILNFEKLDKNDSEGYYLVVWSVRGTVGAIIDWLNHGMVLPKKEFADILRRILDKL